MGSIRPAVLPATGQAWSLPGADPLALHDPDLACGSPNNIAYASWGRVVPSTRQLPLITPQNGRCPG